MANKRTEAQRKYDREHCRYFYLKYNIGTDKDIIDKLDSVPSKQDYIRQLIRGDINTNDQTKPTD